MKKSASAASSPAAGFTLIELLVVIAIITILGAILFPVFSQARENARRASCTSNFEQISLGLLQYLQDADDRFPATVTERQAPSGTPGTAADRAQYSIKAELQPYLKSEQVFADPSSVIDWGTIGAGNWYPTDYGFHLNESQLAPAANNQATWYTNNPDFGRNNRTPLAAITYPSQFIITADAGRADGTPSRGGLYPMDNLFPGAIGYTAAQASPEIRHQGGFVVAYADGHAKWVKPEATWKDINSNQWRRNPTPLL